MEKNRTTSPLFEDLQVKSHNTEKELSSQKCLSCRRQPAPAATAAASPEWDRPGCQMMPCCTSTSSYITRSEAALTHESTHSLTHKHEREQCRCHFFLCLHTHTRTPAGWGGAKSQDSCGLINYHLKETKVGPPEVAAFPSNCSKAVSWKVKNTFKSLGVRTETRRPWDCYSNIPACTLKFRHLKSVNLSFTSDVFHSCFLSLVTTLSLNFSDGKRTFVLQNRRRLLLSIFSVY